MDAVAIASGIQTAKIGSEIVFAVAKKALDSQKAEGAAVIKLIEAAANVGKGPSIPGVGEQVDQTA